MSPVPPRRVARLATPFARVGLSAALLLVASVLAVPPQLGCSRFTEPCHLSEELTLFSDPSMDASVGSIFEGPSGETVLRFTTYAKVAMDGGTPGGDVPDAGVVGGFGSVTSTASPVPSKVDIVTFPGPAGGSLRSAFAAPLTLQGRVGSTLDMGVTYTGQGVLFSWVEQSTRTDPDGKVHTGAALRYAFAVGADPPPTHDVLACDDCTIQAAPVSTKDTTFLFYAVVQQGKAPSSSLLRMSPSGVMVAKEAVPTSLAPAGTVPRLSTSGGALVVRLAGGSYVLRDDLALSAGPFVPRGSVLSFVYGDGDPYAAWLEVPGSTSSADGGVTFGDVGFEGFGGDVGQSLILGRFSPGASVTRISTASNVLGVARDLDTFGVAFTSSDREYFALAGADGQKIGGDLDIGTSLSMALGAQGNRRVVRSTRGPRTFSVMGLSGSKLLSREVSCE